jgi:putative selenate reductase
MSHMMRPLSFVQLLHWILDEYEARESIFGIPRELFYLPEMEGIFATNRLFGEHLATPIGPAAGPHTQLAQNIISAWLCGGRFIELKTVQIMDELEIPRPCIDMADEGYNVEWSQELKLEESAEQYAAAWALVHVLRRLLKLDERVPFGTIFNMSVGYDLQGIRQPRMQTFLDQMADARSLLKPIRSTLQRHFPRFADVEISDSISHSVTLSTMHGCPPEEIERIARYLLEERGLHTTVKLNPTLLGKTDLLEVLHGRLGFVEIQIPDAVFAHDLSYDKAQDLIRSLKRSAERHDRQFAVKLSNTLAMGNHRGVLPGDEMYMSGRALFPITVSLFERLRGAFSGDLHVSFSAGANADNVASLLRAGACPVTVASDLLKPGGYGRFGQYLDRIGAAMHAAGVSSLSSFASEPESALAELTAQAIDDPKYRKAYGASELPKVTSVLSPFDCITAPCIEQCAACQDVPEYVSLLAAGNDDAALQAVLRRNPLPTITGYICTHLCQTRCTRANYDQPVAIRALKRFAAERGRASAVAAPANGKRVAVIGSGPSGLSAAFYLAFCGFGVTVFESKPRAGGMPALAPGFRIPRSAVDADVDRVKGLGVEIQLDHPITQPPSRLLKEGYDAVYLACGFPTDALLPNLAGADARGVMGALSLLDAVARDKAPDLGKRVVVIGGGNTAMDAARTAQRLTGRPVTVVYRRTRNEMPAEQDEIAELVAEGNELLELVSPVRVEAEGGSVVALRCIRNRLGEPDSDGRRRPVPIEGSEFSIEADAVILAVGQRPPTEFLESGGILLNASGSIRAESLGGRTSIPGIYAGGDLVRGPSIIIAAAADGRHAAEAICERLDIEFRTVESRVVEPASDLRQRRTRRIDPQRPAERPLADRGGFDAIEAPLSEEQVRLEAARCLQCSLLCDKCVDVCPNRANVVYELPLTRVECPIVSGANGSPVGSETLRIGQSRQIVHVDELCNECGNCATFCVHEGRPYQDKPRLFLNRANYAAEEADALHLAKDQLLIKDASGAEAHLTLGEAGSVYVNPRMRVELSATSEPIKVEIIEPTREALSTRPAVEASILARGLHKSVGYLLRASEEEN